VPLVLDILRHGEAEPAGASGDEARALSPAGRMAMAALAATLAGEGWRPGRIFSSPLKRARQTAEMVRGAARDAPPIERLGELGADREPHEVLTALAAHGATAGHVLLVTHQPLAGRLTAILTGKEAGFRPGTLVRIELDAGLVPRRGRVVRTIPPAPG
jgi:phosphohistidine phosphatase